MDCFASLAMTEDMPSRSRDSILHPSFCKFVVPLLKRGRRESRVPTAPAVSCAKMCIVDAHEHTGSAETARLSPRNGFTAYFVLSPVSGLFCHRHLRNCSTSLAPASRRQDHTTSPYAFVPSSCTLARA